jgi:hypothetical protein
MTPKAPPRKRSEEIVACLTGGMSQVKTATELGISLSTVKRVAADCRPEIDAARAEQTRRVAADLRDRALYAATRLEQMIDSNNDAVAISAIRTALGEALRWADAIDTDERLRAVEARLGLRAVAG